MPSEVFPRGRGQAEEVRPGGRRPDDCPVPKLCAGRDSNGDPCWIGAGSQHDGVFWCRYCYPPRVEAKACYEAGADPTGLSPEAQDKFDEMVGLFGGRLPATTGQLTLDLWGGP